jgi:hypothetical protein
MIVATLYLTGPLGRFGSPSMARFEKFSIRLSRRGGLRRRGVAALARVGAIQGQCENRAISVDAGRWPPRACRRPANIGDHSLPMMSNPHQARGSLSQKPYKTGVLYRFLLRAVKSDYFDALGPCSVFTRCVWLYLRASLSAVKPSFVREFVGAPDRINRAIIAESPKSIEAA